jgi:glycosyltransferase involved in cell wall biosynthesis
VTPFFNTAEFLGTCIESVLAQTRRDFEYILVDNCSSDGSAQIAEAYAKRDARIRVVRNASFLSQVQNYDAALEQIAPGSRYVKLAQADDWLFPNCLAEMTLLADEHPSIGMVSSYDLRGRRVRGVGLPPEKRVLSGREACRWDLLNGVFLFGSPTTVMYRADIVRSRRPFYAEGRYHEDTEAAFEILETCDFGFVHQILSYLRTREGSLTGTARTFDPEPLDRLIRVTKYGRRYLEEDEYQPCLRETRRAYYRQLASSWLVRREPAYWAYHRKGLASIGQTIDRRELALRVVSKAAGLALPAGLRTLARGWRRSSASEVGRSPASK